MLLSSSWATTLGCWLIYLHVANLLVANGSSKKINVDEIIEKFNARLVIQGFRQKSGIDYFDTYSPVACINTIRLLIAFASIHNLIIHQMVVKTTFLKGELDEEVHMNQPQGFIMPGNENKVDDMLIFGTDQDQVDLTKGFLSSSFSMKDMGEANVILSIRIKHESNRISISQSHYIEKELKKFNYFDCTLVSTPIDTSEKLMPNNVQVVSQLEYSRVIGCLMYAMTCTRPDISFAVGKLSRYSSNPGTRHWQAIQRVFLLGGGAVSWASKKQTCIISSTMKYEFVALAAAAPISILCDSVATLAKAYSQVYNGKSRQLGVRHNMIHELIMNGVVSIEFVRSQQNLADHLTKGLDGDLVLKSAEGMGLKSN
uniref:Reverse transcriptase Ty1/copia-type domain-containing protein n=1 Tax=Tanacetum cinerariifolium TaxID=118510 RepID=A0A6L2JPK9_TANCI|nr:hypothetical protein [Tanacetum cinerariifolium]